MSEADERMRLAPAELRVQAEDGADLLGLPSTRSATSFRTFFRPLVG